MQSDLKCQPLKFNSNRTKNEFFIGFAKNNEITIYSILERKFGIELSRHKERHRSFESQEREREEKRITTVQCFLIVNAACIRAASKIAFIQLLFGFCACKCIWGLYNFIARCFDYIEIDNMNS